MGEYVASRVIKMMIHKEIKVKGAEIILGITFKENCPDVRNTKVVDVVAELRKYSTKVTIYDPWANEKEVMSEFGLVSTKDRPNKKFDAIVITVAHNEFKKLKLENFIKKFQ